MTDEELIAGCQNGKNVAQKELFQKFSGRMMAVCMRYMGDHDKAKDVLQDGFVKVFNGIGLFKSDGSLEGWIRRIMVNTALNQLRKHQDLRLDDYPESFELHADFDNSLNRLSEKELLNMISRLPNGYRMVFNLFVLEGFNHQEIAEKLQITESTSRTQLLKARNALQKMILKSNSIADYLLVKRS